MPGGAPGAGVGEFYALPVFTCAGLMFMASAVDFVFIFVSLELVTISFYVLVPYLRRNPASLEAGVKYLILGALSTGFFVYGITWIFGVTGETNLGADRRAHAGLSRLGDGAPLRHHARAGRPRLQGRRRALPALGAGCLSRRAHPDHRLSLASARKPLALSCSCGCCSRSSACRDVGAKVLGVVACWPASR